MRDLHSPSAALMEEMEEIVIPIPSLPSVERMSTLERHSTMERQSTLDRQSTLGGRFSLDFHPTMGGDNGHEKCELGSTEYGQMTPANRAVIAACLCASFLLVGVVVWVLFGAELPENDTTPPHTAPCTDTPTLCANTTCSTQDAQHSCCACGGGVLEGSDGSVHGASAGWCDDTATGCPLGDDTVCKGESPAVQAGCCVCGGGQRLG